MSAPASRRALLSGLAVLPALTVPTAAGSPELAAIVDAYINADRHLRAESDRVDQAGKCMDEGLGEAITACGRYRAQIALYPVSCLADVMLKVRAIAAVCPPEEGEDCLRETIESRGGHAYIDDVAEGVMIDLMRIRGVA